MSGQSQNVELCLFFRYQIICLIREPQLVQFKLFPLLKKMFIYIYNNLTFEAMREKEKDGHGCDEHSTKQVHAQAFLIHVCGFFSVNTNL